MSKEENISLRKYTEDLHALENHFLKAVKKQKSSSKVKDEDVIDLLHEMDKIVSGHVKSLGRHVERLGGEFKADLKTKIASFTGSIAGLIEGAQQDTVSKMIRDDYTAMSMIAIGYTMLHTHALAEEDQILAEMTQNHLTDCTALVTEISKIAPLVVSRDVIHDKDRAEDIGRKAVENTQHAWKPEVVNRKQIV